MKLIIDLSVKLIEIDKGENCYEVGMGEALMLFVMIGYPFPFPFYDKYSNAQRARLQLW